MLCEHAYLPALQGICGKIFASFISATISTHLSAALVLHFGSAETYRQSSKSTLQQSNLDVNRAWLVVANSVMLLTTLQQKEFKISQQLQSAK